MNMPMPSSLELRDTPLLRLPKATVAEPRVRLLDASKKVERRGRFFFRGDEKFFLKEESNIFQYKTDQVMLPGIHEQDDN